MTRFFGIPIQTFTGVLLFTTIGIIAVVLLLALFNRIFFKIGVRNIPRRRMQMVLIVFALMLSTTLLSSVLATGDVMTSAVKSVAIYNWGSVDELIQGGRGSLGTFSERIYREVRDRARSNPKILGVGASLREFDLLIADQTSRQVRSKVLGLGIVPDSERDFGGMIDQTSKRRRTIAELPPAGAYVNQTLAQMLNAHNGDTLYLYSQRWPGKRYAVRIAGIVSNDGLVGDAAYLLTSAKTFQDIEKAPGRINQIYVANSGGLNGVNYSDEVTEELHDWLPDNVHAIPVKQQGVEVSQTAQELFSRVFALFALFALAIGLLLIFLIFVLLAAERRAEMGMARAIGVQRRHLVLMFLFEGTLYDLLSSFVGLLFGVSVGAFLVHLLEPLLARFNFPLKLTLQPDSLIIAYCLGVIFTFCSVALSAWLVSRMTVVEALRDLPEPSHAPPSLGELGAQLLHLLMRLNPNRPTPGNQPKPSRAASLRRIRRLLFEQIPDVLIDMVREVTRLGFIPLFAGLWLLQWGLNQLEIIPFSLGLSLFVVGVGLLLSAILRFSFRLFYRLLKRRGLSIELEGRWRAFFRAFSPFALVVGGVLVAYWALPFDALELLGLPRFSGGIELFFIAGVMMVLGTAWALIANASLLAAPLLALFARLPRLYALARLASAYPLHRRFRTGLSVVMFSLVVFAMTVMAVITNAMQSSYVNINNQTGGFDVQATAYFKPLGNNLDETLRAHGVEPSKFAAIATRVTTTVGVLQLSAEQPRWAVYPAQVVDGGFLQGYGLHLTAHAQGFANDAAVWKALQTHPEYVLIDSSALPYSPDGKLPVYDPSSSQPSDSNAPTTPPGVDEKFAYHMSGVYQGDTTFPATPLWVIGFQGKEAVKLTVIGVVDNSDSAHFGLYIPKSSYSSAGLGTITSADKPEAQSYYFKVAPGQDARAQSLALGSAFLDNGLETTVLEDLILQVRGPRILLSNILLGVVAMTLLLGVAALAITGTRAVVERRQQIGMLRALGCKRGLIQGAFLLESFLVGAMGSTIGLVLGLLLARNIFAANFFEQYQTGLSFSVPWQQLGIIAAVALGASFLGALLPAWQAGRIAPAEAIRYQ